MYRLLIVEDEHYIRKWLTYMVNYKELGIIVVGEAENGLQGAEMIQTLNPDIVLTDINMPVMDAFQMFKETQDNRYKKIILSGYNDFENARLAMHHGVRDFLSKPLNAEELKSSLKDLVLELQQERKEELSLHNDQYDTLEAVRPSQDILVNQILIWIQQHFQEKFTVADIAKSFGYSESYIYKKVKDHLGITINDYTSRYRVKQAISKLVEDPQLMIYEVAEQTGFSDYNYFNKVFKKYIGMNASDFRENIL
ncbi:response regulator transcription factor [Vagococcus acidifermentans]|uniref:DNA-binding response regulator n=1 Tax=Vagococcus acidifermentans TaxID=564710 RepID=A0A430B0S6_9ENTE|nr:response regulator [Vagococcus acidifermentans]RSU13851.1 DNA-binding response regulator [Vagococcus acidifermentans]